MIAAEKQALVADLHMRRTDIRYVAAGWIFCHVYPLQCAVQPKLCSSGDSEVFIHWISLKQQQKLPGTEIGDAHVVVPSAARVVPMHGHRLRQIA